MNIPKNIIKLKWLRRKFLPDETFKVYNDADEFILNCQFNVLGIHARWLVSVIENKR